MTTYAAVKAIATYLPPEIENNTGSIVEKIGISSRHIAKTESTGDMAVAAAEQLFVNYNIDKKDIDFILLCTQQPDYLLPTTACIIQAQLGLSKKCGALDFNLGCSGYIYGLSLVKGLIETGLAKNVLLLTSFVYSKYVNPKDAVNRPIFGDGATATLISAQEGDKPFLRAFSFGTDGTGADKLIIPAGGDKNPSRTTPEKFTEDKRGNIRSNYELYMDGQEMTFFLMKEVPRLVEDVLAKAMLTREDIDYYVFHQANKFMLERIQKKCRLDGLPYYNDCKNIGNTVAGTVPFALDAILQGKSTEQLKNTFLAGFGVGFSWAGCIADLSTMLQKR